jgi:putative transposase
MPKTYTKLLTHVVFSTKERLPLISDDYRPRLHAYMGGIVRELGVTALIIGGTADHIHLLLGLPPDIALSEVMRVVKTNSSRWMLDSGSVDFSWQRGFGAFSVSAASISSVTHYIANQEQHHQQKSYRDEFVEFLQMSGIEFEDRYLWS